MARMFITGSADGLGRATAQALLSDGHEVIVHARSTERLAAVQDLIGRGASAVVGDLADLDQTRAVAEQVNELGRVDAVIHNAGVLSGPQVMPVNIVAPYLLTAVINRPQRLIYLSSDMHHGGRADVAGLDWSGRRATGSYSDSKLFVTTLALAVAGPNQSEENPLGEGGERVHDWVVPLAAWRQSHGEQGGEVNECTRIFEESVENVGAGVMGRNMFGPVRGGAWGDEQWTGWWGDNPPYHYPVFILTHYPRDPVEMEGGTTFRFVTDGIESALEQAREAAGGKTSCFGAAATSLSSTWQRDCWTSLSSTLFQCCSATVLASSTTSGTRRCGLSRSGPSRRPASRTSSTEW